MMISTSTRNLKLFPLFITLFITIIIAGSLYAQLLPQMFPMPFIPQAYQQVQQNKAHIKKQFPIGQLNYNKVSFFIKTEYPLSVVIGVVCKNGQMLYLEVIPQDGSIKYLPQNQRIIIPAGSEKKDGKWHEWQIDSMELILSAVGLQYNFIASLELIGESFCFGKAINFYEDDDGNIEVSYLESFLEGYDAVEDYGWIALTPIKSEFDYPIEDEEEGYLCIYTFKAPQQVNYPTLPVTFPSNPIQGFGPILPVTLFSNQPALTPSFLYPDPYIARLLVSQAYTPPINPILAYGFLQSIPLYLNTRSGQPYSIQQNIYTSSSAQTQ